MFISTKGDDDMKRLKLILTFSLLVIYAAVLVTGCARVQQARGVEKSGFLGDYSQLEKGGGDRAMLYYVNPDANFALYDKIILDSVSIWYEENSKLKNVPENERENMAHYLYSAVRKQLEKKWEIVDQPGKDTLRIRLALTEAVGANSEMNNITTYLPPARLISEGASLSTGSHIFVGEATAEMEIIDSTTGKRLGAFVDKRTGGKHYEGATDTWSDVKKACDWWAETISTQLSDRGAK
jgi:hypothetical protein